MKKFIACLVVLIICAAGVFYRGWLQFAVPVGKYGVLVTKTSGVYPQTIQRGVFIWNAERLLPTNAKLYIFNAEPYTIAETVFGELPSAQLYSAVMEQKTLSGQKPDFSYAVTVSATLRLKPEDLPTLCDQAGVTSQDSLEAFLRQRVKEAANLVRERLLAQEKIDAVFVSGLQRSPAFFGIEVLSLVAENPRLPDMALYNMAKESYEAYLAGAARQTPPASGSREALDWYQAAGVIRTRTRDAKSVAVEPVFGYKTGAKETQAELASRLIELKDLLRRYFAQKISADLRPADEETLRQEIRAAVNTEILRNAQILDVRFLTLDVTD